MAGAKDKIVQQSLKSVDGVVKTLIKPYLQQLKQWSQEKELKGKLEPEALAKLLEPYLMSLANKVSEITSMAFPQAKLKMAQAYEPLALERRYPEVRQNRHYDQKLLLNGQFNSLIVIDSAGMGKTTFSQYIISQILFKSNHIPILFELRKVDMELDLIENLAQLLDMPDKPFPRALFTRLLSLGKFFVVLDGFDEVPLEHQPKLAERISELCTKDQNNKLILTSRPQDSIPALSKCSSLTFKTFTLEQTESLIRRYDQVSNLAIGERLIAQLSSVPNRFLETPLLVSLLYRTFSINNTIADRVCTFYDEIYQALYKGHDLINKNGYAREKKSALDFEDFRRLLRNLCFYMAVSKQTAFESDSMALEYIKKAAKMAALSPNSGANYLDDLLVAVPLMVKEGNEIKFCHKTILEYFAAEYLVHHKDSYGKMKQIFDSSSVQSFDKIFEFVFELAPSLYHAVITKPMAEKVLKVEADGWKDVNEAVLNTFALICQDTKVGLWKESDFYGNDKGGSFAIRNFNYNGTPYRFAINVHTLDIKFHKNAFLILTTDIDRIKGLDIPSDEKIERLIATTGINQWLELNPNSIKRLKDWDIVVELADRLIQRHYYHRYHRAFNPIQAQQILQAIENEQQQDNEIEALLN